MKKILFAAALFVPMTALAQPAAPPTKLYASAADVQALIAQAKAEDEAAIARAHAATRRVVGWADAAKKGCADLGRAGDRACEEQLLRDAATYSIAKEGHEGVIISVGAPVAVAVNPNQPRPSGD